MPDNNGDNAGNNGGGGDDMTLDSVLEMGVSELTDEHRSFLSEHTDELTDDDLEYYGVERKPTIPDPYTPGGDGDGGDGGGEGGDDEILIDGERVDPAQVKVMTKIIEKRVGGKLNKIEGEMGGSSKMREIDSYIEENSDFKPYREAMVKFVNANPRYASLDVEELAAVVARKDLVKIGARREREAQRKANVSRNPGRTTRTPQKRKGKDWANMSIDEYNKARRKALGHI